MRSDYNESRIFTKSLGSTGNVRECRVQVALSKWVVANSGDQHEMPISLFPSAPHTSTFLNASLISVKAIFIVIQQYMFMEDLNALR